MAATLARRQGKFVPIRVLNPSGRKRFIGMGDVMATYQAVDVLEATGRQKTRSAREESVDQPLTKELEDLYHRSREGLAPRDQGHLRDLLEEYQDIFSTEGKQLGKTSLVQHTISTGSHRPIKQPPWRAPLGQEEIVQEELDKMLRLGVIEPSSSAWASPVVLVKKKDGSVRFCIDYRSSMISQKKMRTHYHGWTIIWTH